ncbi:MAG: hypothetical protein N2485_00880 [bacterium]|nr:hypothetical protein [bacterium]
MNYFNFIILLNYGYFKNNCWNIFIIFYIFYMFIKSQLVLANDYQFSISDYVIYEIYNSFEKEKFYLLAEQIIYKNGEKLGIKVSIKNPKDINKPLKEFILFVTDNLYNKQHEKVDRIFILKDSKKIEIQANKQNLYELFKQCIPPIKEMKLINKDNIQFNIAGRVYSSVRYIYEYFENKDLFILINSDEIKWNNIGLFLYDKDMNLLFKRVLVDFK